MSIGTVLSIALLFVLLVAALALRDNIAREFGGNSEKGPFLEPGEGVFDDEVEEMALSPSPKFIDRTVDPPPEDDDALAARTGLTQDHIDRLREITHGELSQFCAYEMESADWCVPVLGLRIDKPNSALRDLRDAIMADPLFAKACVFIVSDALGYEDAHGGIVVLIDADPFEPYRMVPGESEEGPMTDSDTLDMLEEWHSEAPFEIVWASPNGFELAFEPTDSGFEELVHDAEDLFPEAVNRVRGAEGLSDIIRTGKSITFWWT